MKLEVRDVDEIDGNVIKIWFIPETPTETRLLEKLKDRISKIDPLMLKLICSWWERLKTKEPELLLKFPECWCK